MTKSCQKKSCKNTKEELKTLYHLDDILLSAVERGARYLGKRSNESIDEACLRVVNGLRRHQHRKLLK
jgi:hypothetical protein